MKACPSSTSQSTGRPSGWNASTPFSLTGQVVLMLPIPDSLAALTLSFKLRPRCWLQERHSTCPCSSLGRLSCLTCAEPFDTPLSQHKPSTSEQLRTHTLVFLRSHAIRSCKSCESSSCSHVSSSLPAVVICITRAYLLEYLSQTQDRAIDDLTRQLSPDRP